MTRHARNCTAGAVYTYNEKKRDSAKSGYGTNAKRLDKDSIKSFDCCSLTLQPCRKPVITKQGYLFDKEAILEYIVTKKNEYSRQLKAYERVRRLEEDQLKHKAQTQHQARLESFVNAQKPVDRPSENTSASLSTSSSISNINNSRLPSFWLPSECPNAGLAKVKKPDPLIYCPVSQQPLRVKDLIEVKFTPIKEDGKGQRSLITKEARYMCPITHDVLSNSVPCAVLRTTGDVVTMECVERLIKKDMIHPLTNDKLKDKDIIPLQRGGTGFASTNDSLQAKEKRPTLQV
ncbi:nitric oxide synthase-interacting protein homolog [Drosophila kikkawai]|uniref:Nitric oxide synthase-interacting protein homolog n=1 Tax=Drosophila kikkawai TaxID=30033 RepID=A0A6P4JBU3_DROKI|nr:nitric oxide synthase-interacting protein homolog [Drosophila kikkawai]